MTSNMRDRLTAFEGYLDRIAAMVQTTHKDTMQIRCALNVPHPEREVPEVFPSDPVERDRWLGRTSDWKGKQR
jgi:hypothetical protein